jgi:hypothetical protein
MALFRDLGVASSQQCDLASVINPFETDCWTGPSSAVKYDLRRVRLPPPTPSHNPADLNL